MTRLHEPASAFVRARSTLGVLCLAASMGAAPSWLAAAPGDGAQPPHESVSLDRRAPQTQVNAIKSPRDVATGQSSGASASKPSMAQSALPSLQSAREAGRAQAKVERPAVTRPVDAASPK